MGDRSQNQEMRDVNGNAQQSQAGRDVFAFQNSPEARVIIQKSFISLFGGKSEHLGIDWDWGIQILKQQQPDIKKRLKDSLFGLAEVDALEVKSMRQEDSPELLLEAIKSVTVTGTEEKILDPQKPIIATYARQDIQGKLLILGTPGSGKTITLLKLAEQLVGEAIENPKTIIPIIFELSTWRDGQDIEAWLIEQLYENYGGNRKRKIYEMWVERRVLLPLLDGLDELGMVRQKACTKKVNEFAKHYPQVVVCCRVKAFQQAGVNLSNLRGKVQVKPLSDSQIKMYLQQVGKLGLWQQIQTVPEMARLLKTVMDVDPDYDEPGLLRVPLFISLAAQVYEPNRPLKGKEDLFERYIDQQLSFEVRGKDRNKESGHFRKDWRETRYSLGWIAERLKQHNQVEFLIERIQPNWLKSKYTQLGYKILGGAISGLIGYLLGGTIFGLIGVALGRRDNIKPFEAFQFSLNHLKRKNTLTILHIHLKSWLKNGTLSTLFFTLITGIFFWILSSMEIEGLFLGFVVGIISGLTVMLFSGLVFGLTFSLLAILRGDLKIHTYPNQGNWNSLQSMILTSIFNYPAGVLLVSGLNDLPMIVFKTVFTVGPPEESTETFFSKRVFEKLRFG